MSRISILDMHNPPSGHQVEAVRRCVDACSYPLARLLPALRNRGKDSITIRWAPTPIGSTAQWDNTATITISPPDYDGHHRVGPTAFLLAHELGHAVASLTLGLAGRQEVTDLLHTGLRLPWFGPSHDHDRELWNDPAHPWALRLTEAFADLFVHCFAPSLVPAHQRERVGHWVADLDHARHRILEYAPMPFTDVAPNHPHAENIEWLAAQGITTGDGEGYFHPDQPVTRGQMATFLRRLHELR